jgi:hypothetical protein
VQGIIDSTYLEWRAEQWNQWLEEGKIIEITHAAKSIGFTCKVVVTSGLFGDLQPFAEEAVKGHSLESRLGELFDQFKKAQKFATQDHMEFELKFSHMVKDGTNFLEPETFKKNTDKSLTVIAGKLVDDEGKPALVFIRKDTPKVQPSAT